MGGGRPGKKNHCEYLETITGPHLVIKSDQPITRLCQFRLFWTDEFHTPMNDTRPCDITRKRRHR